MAMLNNQMVLLLQTQCPHESVADGKHVGGKLARIP